MIHAMLVPIVRRIFLSKGRTVRRISNHASQHSNSWHVGILLLGAGLSASAFCSLLPPWYWQLLVFDNLVSWKYAAPSQKELLRKNPTDIRRECDAALSIEAAHLANVCFALGYERVVEHILVRGAEIQVYIYKPRQVEGRLPLIVWFHGGGMCLNCAQDLALTRYYWDGWGVLESFQGKAVVASVEYRLAPEHQFPTGVEDAIDAVRYLQRNAAKYNCDSERLCVAGHSAGGYLAAVVQQASRDQGFPVACAVVLNPMCRRGATTQSYIENGHVTCLTTDIMLWYWLHYCPDPVCAQDPRCEPIRGVGSGRLTPCLVVTAKYDALRDEGVEYYEALRKAGVQAEHIQLRTSHAGGPCDVERWRLALDWWHEHMGTFDGNASATSRSEYYSMAPRE